MREEKRNLFDIFANAEERSFIKLKKSWDCAKQITFMFVLCLMLCACQARGQEGVGEAVAEPENGRVSGFLEGEKTEDDSGFSEGEKAEENKGFAGKGEMGETPEEILAELRVDATHDAFLVETGGRMGTVLVTGEKQEGSTVGSFSVWDPRNMESPIQTMEIAFEYERFGEHLIVDANFDGLGDFAYLENVYGNSECWGFWFWDEETCQFENAYIGGTVFNPVFLEDCKMIACLSKEDGSGIFYSWGQDDRLSMNRSIEVTEENGKVKLMATVKLQEVPVDVFECQYAKDSGEWEEQWELWCDPGYYGKPGSMSERLHRQGIPEGTISAFVIRTGSDGREMLVTAQPCGADDVMDTTGAQCRYDGKAVRFSVWNPEDMSEPLQTVCKYVEEYHYREAGSYQHEMVDANFDGYMDFAWLCHSGNQPTFYYLWVWDEEVQKFVEEPAYNEISMPMADAEKKTITGRSRSSAAQDGRTTIHKWLDGELVCVREIEVWQEIDADDYTMTVKDRVDGGLVEVYRAEFPESREFGAEQGKWENPDYHGEP